MSMLSAQIDELRQVAQVYRNLGKHATEQMLLDAADTILELRDDLQRANAENAKMLEEFMKMDQWHSRELEAAMDENAKLWELARHMHTCMGHYEPDGSVSCDRCPLDNDTGNCDFERRMQELRVKVDR